MIDINLIYQYATRFAKMAQSTVTLSKRYVLSQFFNAFKDKYVIVYDSVAVDEPDTKSNVVHMYGPSMKFDFVESPKQTLPVGKINNEVNQALTGGSLKDFIHSVGVEATDQNKRYTCHLTFNTSVDSLTD